MTRKAKARRSRGSSKAGRPRKDGDRYPSGKLKPQGPNQLTVDRRRALAADITKASNPLDCAHANGWIEPKDHRAGWAYAALHRQAALGSPGLGAAQDMSASGGVEVDVGQRTWGTMSDLEIAAVWDSAFSGHGSQEEQDAAQAVAMARWKRITGAMTQDVREELDLVCLRQSWPQWLIQRCAGAQMSARAAAERRALTEDELAHMAKRFTSGFEHKRDLLLSGLKTVRDLASDRPPQALVTPRAPKVPLPRWAKRTEKTDYVDEDGNLLRTATRFIPTNGA